MKPISTVLLGKGELAVRVAGWLFGSQAHNLTYVVPVVPEPSWSTSLIDWARGAGVPVCDSGRCSDVPAGDIDLAISVFYDRIIDRAFICRCRRIVNLHNSPLPRYRGVRPINWALKNGERTHGVTIHEITEGIDAGPIIAQLTYSIYPEFDEVGDVLDRATEYGWVLFKETAPLLDRIVPTPQDESKATYYNLSDSSKLEERSSFTREQSDDRAPEYPGAGEALAQS